MPRGNAPHQCFQIRHSPFQVLRIYLPLTDQSSAVVEQFVEHTVRRSVCLLYTSFWYGTKNGLCRYDGNTFEIFESLIQDTTSISGNSIYALFEDSRKTLWAATNNGVCKYVRRFNNFHTISGSSAVRAFAELADGTILVATSQGVRKLDIDADMLVDFGTDTGNYVTAPAFSIVEDSVGEIWVATIAGICVIDPKNGTVRKYKHITHDARSLPSNDISTIFRDSDDKLWIGTRSSGICRYDSRTDSFVRMSG